MNISFENVDKVNALLTIKLEKADYEEKVTAALKDFRKKANMPGFRPGQVPMGLLKKRFGTEITAEEVNKILGHEIYKYIHEQSIKILRNRRRLISGGSGTTEQKRSGKMKTWRSMSRWTSYRRRRVQDTNSSDGRRSRKPRPRRRLLLP